MTDIEQQLIIAQNAVALMFALLLILSALVLIQPAPEMKPKAKAREECKLHQRPVDECRDQHGD